MTFQVRSLEAEPFQQLFALDDTALSACQATRMVADAPNSFPCRVSLEDAEQGDELLLLTYDHQPAGTHAASGPIFVRRGVPPAALAPSVIPLMLESRLLSVRAYGSHGGLVKADVTPGKELRQTIEEMFGDPEVAYLHVHFARPGCFACRVERF